jgi:hypothetical protein
VGQVPPPQPLQRTDVLDAGRDTPPLRERWRRLPVAARLALAAVLAAALGAGGTLAWRERAEEQRAQRERAAAGSVANLDARLLTARARGPAGTREIKLRTVNTGPLPVGVVGGELTLAGVGPLDAAVEPVDVDPAGAAVVRVRTVPADCPGAVPEAADALVLQVRTADGEVRPVPLALGPAVWSQIARAVGCAGS